MTLQAAVDMLGMIQQMLPLITTLVTRCQRNETTDEMCHRYYAVVESEHPYKPAAVHNYHVCAFYCQSVEVST